MASKPRMPMMTDGKRDLPLESRSAPITTVNAESRTIEVTWTTGAPVDRIDWFSGERYVEELVVSDKAIRLDRLNAGAPVLDNHDRFSGLKSMLAVVDRAWIEKGEGRAIVRFPKAEDDPDADRVFRKILDGIIRSLSVGYKRLKIEVDKRKEPTVWRVVDWEPFEISFVAIPADINAQVRADDASSADRRKSPSEADVSFARDMIPHHEAAIEMAREELKKGTDPEMRKLAEEIIEAQEAEIERLKKWLEEHDEKPKASKKMAAHSADRRKRSPSEADTYRCEFRAAPGENEARRIRMRMRSLASAR